MSSTQNRQSEQPGNVSAKEANGAELKSSDEANHKKADARLGAFLCWGVVFADVGTSVYFTAGILYGQSGGGTHAALYLGLTLIVFMLLTLKYREVAVRYPEGGGVVTVASHALNPFAGLVGGLLIVVDYFLTAAVCVLSGFIYMSAVAPAIGPYTLPLAIAALVGLAILNLLGVSESAKITTVFSVVAAISQLLVVALVIIHVGPSELIAALPRVFSGPAITPTGTLIGYAGAFLAYSGLESISQLSPVMAEPRQRTARAALGMLVVITLLTSPLLTLWSTTVLPIDQSTDPDQFISLLAGFAGGRLAEIEVALTGALLLVFSSNTAMIGCYQVLLALTRVGFLPTVIGRRNKWRQTPHWAILIAVAVPIAVLIIANGSVSTLGDLFAFGLLGAFSLTAICLDIVRWHERHPERTDTSTRAEITLAKRRGIEPSSRLMFAVGVITSALVSIAWVTNLVAKPLATLFGGGITVVGLLIAGATLWLGHRKQPRVFPLLYREGYPVLFMRGRRRVQSSTMVLALLPKRPEQVAALVEAANAAAAGSPVLFVQRGQHDPPTRAPRMMEVLDPYADDLTAQDAFAAAEQIGRKQGREHHYLYLPSTAGAEEIADFWQTMQPRETLAVAGDEDILAQIKPVRVEEQEQNGALIAHYVRAT